MARPELLRLLHACKQEPDDPTARLVLADWLEEHGDADDLARAAFVRLDASPGIPELPWLRARLWASNRRRWMPFGTQAGQRNVSVPHRGLVAARGRLSSMAGAHAAQIAASEAWAWVERLTVGVAPGRMDRLTASPLLPGVPSLTLDGRLLDSASAAQVAEWPGLAALRGLVLGVSVLAPEAASTILRSPLAAGLREAELTAPASEALEQPGLLPCLESLCLPGGQAPRLATILATASWRLRSLGISQPDNSRLDALGRADSCADLRLLRVWSGGGRLEMGELSLARWWPVLEEARIVCHEMADAARLARRADAPRLRSLSLAAMDFADDAIRTLAGSALMARLERLEIIGRIPGGADDIATMAAAPAALSLANCRLDDRDAAVLANWPALASCRALSLSGNYFGPDGMRDLARSPNAGGLVALDLSWNPIGDEGLARLLASPLAPRLRSLGLGGCGISTAGWAMLAGARLDSLQELRADEPALAMLSEALPHVACVC